MKYDVAIIGAGPAGLSAAVYCGRKKLKTLVIGKDIGGQIARTSEVHNYPGHEKISGAELIKNFEEQAKGFNVEIIYDEIKEIKRARDWFEIFGGKKYSAKAVILAFGKTPRSLEVPGEKKFRNRGVSYCAICDGPIFAKKQVAVIGGGNSALDAANYLSKLASKVYLIHRRDEFRGDEPTAEEIKKLKNVEIILNSAVAEVKGDKFVKSIIIENVNTKKKAEIKVDCVFVEIGFEVKSDFVKNIVKLDSLNQIVINNRNETSCPGIFAAGDATNVPFKQAIVAAGEGAKAALSAYNFLHGKKPAVTIDWK